MAMLAALEHTFDLYNGVNINTATLPATVEVFRIALEKSLELWRTENRRGIWVRIPADKAFLIPVAIEFGFKMHQVEGDVLSLSKWLPETKNTLPDPPFTYIGVGGFVVNDKNEVLVVKEKSGPAARYGIWKVPGGIVDPKEYLHEAAIREVREETGIETEFISVVSARHMPEARMGMADIYFTCLMKPLSSEIKIQEAEIADAKWMNLDEFLQNTTFKGLYKKILELSAQAAKGTYKGWTGEKLPLGFRVGEDFLYHGGERNQVNPQ